MSRKTDDIIYVPLGFSQYNRVKFFFSTLAGKIVLVSIIVYGGVFLSSKLFSLFVGDGEQPTDLIWIFAAIIAGATLLITYFIGKIDWEKWLLQKVQRRDKKASPANRSLETRLFSSFLILLPH